MKRNRGQFLAATLAGLIIAAAAGFAVTPASAAGYNVNLQAQVANVASWDVLNVRKWPASYSKKIGYLVPQTVVWVERCIKVKQSSDWCKIAVGQDTGWVNSRYLAVVNTQ